MRKLFLLVVIVMAAITASAQEGIYLGGGISLWRTQLSGEILPQRKLPRTITLRNISSEIGLIKYIFDVASFEEDLTNRV